MRTYLSFLFLFCGLQITIAQPLQHVVPEQAHPTPRIYTEHYYKRFIQFMDEAPISNKDIVMLGNSLTENGGNWAARLGNKHVRNRGIIGDEVMGVYDRLHQILPGHPAKLFLLIGVNDISHGLTSDSIVSMIRTTVERIRKESPDTRLYLQSLLPINESFGRYKRLTGKTSMIPEINKQLEALAKEKGLTYINLFPLFTEKGSNVLRADLTTDGLHLKEEGYKRGERGCGIQHRQRKAQDIRNGFRQQHTCIQRVRRSGIRMVQGRFEAVLLREQAVG